MSSNNQTSANVRQLRLQAPIPALEKLSLSINELKKVYPDSEDKKENN